MCYKIPGIVRLRNGFRKACSDIPHGYTDLCTHILLASFLRALWLVIFLRNISRNAKNKYRRVFFFFFFFVSLDIVCTFVQSFALHFKRLKWLSDSSVYCNLCCRVIGKRNETVLLSKDGNNSTYSSRLKAWKYLCDRSKTSMSAETVLRNWKKRRSLIKKTRTIGSRTEKP